MSNVIELSGHGLLSDATKLPEQASKKAVTYAGAVAALGVVLSVVAAMADPTRFAYSYLVGFCFTATIGAGAVFFVMLQHLVKAGWSVAARRQLEWVAGAVPVLLVLFIPVVIFAARTHVAWWAGPEALHDELLHKKHAWLNQTRFIACGFVYIGIWSVLGWWFSKTSAAQDASGDPALSSKMTKLSAPMMLVWGLSISFAGFDWLMSLQPHWYSTIFGVYTFAGAFVSALAVLGLMTIAIQGAGFYKRVSTVEHRHDIGKLIWAFTIFWSYIAFCQFMLIYYANLPEETVFFRARWIGSWSTVSLLLVFVHFAFPFLFMMSRHVKRHPVGFTVGALTLLFAHYIDMYWLIMPIHSPDGPSLSILADLGGLLAPAGILAVVVALRAGKSNLYPLKDPRLPETLRVENF
jgi:hypothetical protein